MITSNPNNKLLVTNNHENTKQPISTMETPKLSPNLTFYDLWLTIQNPNVKGFLNRICFSGIVSNVDKWCWAHLDFVSISTILAYFSKVAPDPAFSINIPILSLCSLRDSKLALFHPNAS